MRSSTNKLNAMPPLYAFIILLALGCVGCGSQATNKLVGTWQLKTGELENDSSTNSAKNLPGDTTSIDENTNSIFDGVGGGDESSDGMTLVFKSNGSLKTITSFSAAHSEKDWRWSLLSWDAESASAVIRCEMSHESVEKSIQFIDDNSLELVPPNIDVLQTRLRFVRK